MPYGGNIVINATEREHAVEITIKDDGTGIPDEIASSLFVPVVSTGEHTKTGLGTTISLALVESHAGKLTFDTSPQGTTFYISLPKNLATTLDD